MDLESTRKPETMAAVGLVANVVLAAGKLVAGILGHSFALVADAIESLADIVGSFVIWGALRYGAREPDENHPFGHGKAESLGALVVAGLVMIAGLSIGVEALHEIFTVHVPPAPFTLYVLLVVVGVKELLYRITAKVAREASSSAAQVDAGHHRSDAITSLFAFVGISIALIGGPDWAGADDVAAFGAAFVIFWNGWRLAREPLAELMDENAREVAARSTEIALTVSGVKGVEKCEARKMGRNFRVVMHLEVAPDMTVADAHVLTGIVKSTIKQQIPGMLSVLIHVEPYSAGNRGDDESI